MAILGRKFPARLGLLLGLILVGFEASGQERIDAHTMAFLRTQLPGYLPLSQGSRHYRHGFSGAAVQEWRAAAKWGHKRAQLLLGLMHFEGSGVDRDWPKAHAWITLSSSRGDATALKSRDKLWQVMTAEEKQHAADQFTHLEGDYGDQAALDRLTVWFRKEAHRSRGPTPTRTLVPGLAGATPIVGFREKLETAFLGELYPAYDIQYRDFRVIEPESETEPDPGK